MDPFEGATTVRLKGAHGKYLWAEEDNYGVSQQKEDKNQQAFWRVERSKAGSKTKTLRLKSCFDTYLTASENHCHGIAFLSFAGKRVTQMRPENVESTICFDWELVIEQGRMRLKSYCGTFLRANSSSPPWNSRVTHDVPQHENHLDWLVWEVEKVRYSYITPLELVIGPIDRLENEQLPAREKSKNPDEIPARMAGGSERHPVQETAKYPDEATARRVDDSERHPAHGRIHNQGTVMSRKPDEPKQRLVEERPKIPVRRAHESEQHPVQERERHPAMGTTRRTDKLGLSGQERPQNPGVGSVRNADESEQRPVQERARNPGVGTARARDNAERLSAQERSQNPDVGSGRRADEQGRHPVDERERNPIVATNRRAEELEHIQQERPQNPDAGSVRRAGELAHPVRARATNSDVGTPRTDDIGMRPAQEISQNQVEEKERGADESQRRFVQETGRNPDVGKTRRNHDPEQCPVRKRYEKYEKRGVGTARRAPESERLPVQETAKRDQESERRPGQETTRRTPERHPVRETARRTPERRPAQETVRKAQGSERHPIQKTVRNTEVSTARRTDDLDRYSMHERHENLGGTTARRAHESEKQAVQDRVKNLDVRMARRLEESERLPVQERARNPRLESGPYPVYYPEEDRAKHLGVGTGRKADEVMESRRKATSRAHR